MTAEVERRSLLILKSSHKGHDLHSILKGLESAESESKVRAMEKILTLREGGYQIEIFLMPLIKHCLTDRNKAVKRMTFLCLEGIALLDQDNKALPESLLIVSSLRSDLQHANEFVRCMTLRFVSKIFVLDILDPLFGAVLDSCRDTEASVRYEAILALKKIGKQHSIYFTDVATFFTELLPEYEDFHTKHVLLLALYELTPSSAFGAIAKDTRVLKRQDTPRIQVSDRHHRDGYILTMLKILNQMDLNQNEASIARSFTKHCLDHASVAIQIEALRALTKHQDNKPCFMNEALSAVFRIANTSTNTAIKNSMLNIVQSINAHSSLLFDEFGDEILLLLMHSTGKAKLVVYGMVRSIYIAETAAHFCANLHNFITESSTDLVLDVLHELLESPAMPIDSIFDLIRGNAILNISNQDCIFELYHKIITRDPTKREAIFEEVLSQLEHASTLVEALKLANLLESCASTSSDLQMIIMCILSSLRRYTKLSSGDHYQLVENKECITNALLFLARAIEKGFTFSESFLASTELHVEISGILAAFDSNEEFPFISRNAVVCRYLMQHPESDIFNLSPKVFKSNESDETKENGPKQPHFFNQTLSSAADPIHICMEASVENCMLNINAAVTNRTQHSMCHVTLEVVSNGKRGGVHFSNQIHLQPNGGGQQTFCVPLTRDSVKKPFIVKAHFSAGEASETQTLFLRGIRIPFHLWMTETSASFDRFRSLWARLEWEDTIKITAAVPLGDCVREICACTGIPVLKGSSSPGKALQAQLFFYGETIFCDPVLLTLDAESKSSDGMSCAKLTVRSNTPITTDLVNELYAHQMFHKHQL